MSNAAAADATVAHNLANADNSMPFAPHQNVEATFVQGHGEPAAEPTALGLDATAWVALAMIVVIALMLAKKVPAVIGASLDKKIAAIRAQLDEASRLRAEAEALKAEYTGKTAGAEAEAEAIRTAARHEADALLAKARTDADALIERRARMAEDKIGAAERAAIAEVRAKAASAAAAAAATLIGEVHDKAADKALVDAAISRLN
ncbi:F0F1 ATP synthase subunit B family protein [Sphingomonas quercus]|uniref:ATP synthase subunit b n=1 Tax=Sphingomonas quercus TaxID=2842451 RepID=A0ABS6BEE3_9SPHN|nr:F0F1 ATP synthase subunit B [Sphingomonas quercus]MBU3076534.1 F0F1 ATP synthase subunit B [Sphingomonas quercus]